METTPYERGFRDGWLTPEVVHQLGFTSARECLAHQEQLYRNELAALSTIEDRAFVARQSEYFEGCLAALRQSLGQMG